MDFLGFSNVVDATPIINKKDGLTDGFTIKYVINRDGRNVEKIATKYVREFDFNSVENDGNFHGFGRGTVYKRSSGKKAKKVFSKAEVLSLPKIVK